MDEEEQLLDLGQLAGAVEIIQDPVVVYDDRSRIVVVNDRLLAATGYAREELIGQHALVLVPAEIRDQLAPRMNSYISTPVARSLGESQQSAIARKDGSTFEAQLATTPVAAERGSVVVVAIRDVKDLSLQEIRFTGLLEASADATLLCARTGRVVLSNSRAMRLFGLDHLAMSDQPFESLFPQVYATVLGEWIRDAHDTCLTGSPDDVETSSLELAVDRPDGSSIPVEISMGPLRTAQGLMIRVLVRDISERQRLQLEADRIKDDFLATVSHELRTPLTSVLGYGELLEDLGPEDMSLHARSLLEVVLRNARRELRLVDDLLTMVQIGSGDFRIRPDCVDLREILLAAVEDAEPVAEQASIVLSFVGEWQESPVLGDPDRLGQALDNLLSNSIKFSLPGSEVTVELTTDVHTVTVMVSDSGPGIADTDIERVFDRLYRGENAVAAEKQGAGLGLPIVRSIVEAHQGKVIAKCTETGTCFEMTLPRASRAPTPLKWAGV